MKKYPVGMLIGFLFGFGVIHPFSLVFQGLFLPMVKIDFSSFIHAFNRPHLPMAAFFGLFGMIIGVINVFYINRITQEQKRVKLLEGLLPICSYCKRIRDDTGTESGEGKWERIEDYIYRKTDTEFTHGICPECTEKAFPPRKGSGG